MRRIYLGLILIFTLLSISPNVLAQKGGVQTKRADNYYKQFDFQTALEIYETVLARNDGNLYVNGRIGNCYKFLNQIQNAEPYYAVVAESDDTDPVYKFYYAQSLIANGSYDQGLDMMNTYYAIMGNEERIMKSVPSDILERDERYTIKIEDFNSKHADFSPFFLKDELFFISNRKDDAFLLRNDVWSQRPFTQLYRINMKEKDISEMSTAAEGETEGEAEAEADGEKKKGSEVKSDGAEDEEKGKPQVFNKSTVSKRYHEGPIAWDRSLNDVYLTRSNYEENKPIKGDDNEVNLKIVKVAFVNGTTDTNGDFGGKMVNNTTFSSGEYSVAYPTITVDGKYMIFASDMPGGYGGLDLYLAENTGGLWSNAVNMGEMINTPGNEAFPHILPNGTLLFASDGLFGLGGYDIFESKLKPDGFFSVPKNLRAPINSTFDDFGIWIDDLSSHGYFTSNRPSEYGGDDIYSFTRDAFMFEAIVFDSKTKERLEGAEVVLENILDEKRTVLIADGDGYVSSNILPNSKYRLLVQKAEYLVEKAEFSTLEDNIYAEIPLIRDYGILLDITVIDADTKEEIPFSDLSLIELKTEREKNVVTNKYGKQTFELKEGIEYRIKAAKSLDDAEFVYLAVSKDFNTYDTESPAQLYTTIELKKQCVGCEIVIEDILYDLDKYYIRADAAKILDNLVKVLEDNPAIEIELSSHTDCRGSQKYNMWLSAKRAEAAVNYIIESGIDYRRLTAAGYGESLPLQVPGAAGLYCTCEDNAGPGKSDSRCTEEVHQLNRRTAFTILKN